MVCLFQQSKLRGCGIPSCNAGVTVRYRIGQSPDLVCVKTEKLCDIFSIKMTKWVRRFYPKPIIQLQTETYQSGFALAKANVIDWYVQVVPVVIASECNYSDNMSSICKLFCNLENGSYSAPMPDCPSHKTNFHYTSPLNMSAYPIKK